MDMTPQAWPEWYDGRHINEVLFCQQFLEKHPMKCVRGRLFTVDGQPADGVLQFALNEIAEKCSARELVDMITKMVEAF